MAPKAIDAFIMRRCNKSDLRALLGKGGGHQVIVFGQPELWRDVFGLNVKHEDAGGLNLQIHPEPGGRGGFQLHAYDTRPYRYEVRVAVAPILEANAQVAREAKALQQSIDPDKASKDDWIACLVRTQDGNYHMRGMLLSAVPPSLREVESVMAYGRTRLSAGALLDPEEAKVWQALMTHKTVLLFGPPGTGKTRLMLRVKRAFEHGIPDISFDPNDFKAPLKAVTGATKLPPKRRVGFTTFHQSLTYENFVVGLRPLTSNGGQMHIEPQDGLFLELAGHALTDDAAALLLIDELNRGNAADIFGELITVLEPDKRLDDKNKPTVSTVNVRLPVPPQNQAKVPRLTQDFAMPSHFYLLASMNSLDRSVAPLDSAMRRRFRVVHLAPRVDVASEALLGEDKPVEWVADLKAPSRLEVGTIALNAWRHLNKAISGDWGPEFLLGHSYVLGITDAATLIAAFSEMILPQIWELYRDRPNDLAEALRLDSAGADDALATRSEDELDFGLAQGSPIQPRDLSAMSPDDAIRRLFFLAFGRSWSPSGQQQATTAPGQT